MPERLEEAATDELDDVVPAKTRRKTSSESETIDNIAAMVQEGLKDKGRRSTIVEASGDEEKKVEETVVKVRTLYLFRTVFILYSISRYPRLILRKSKMKRKR